MQTSREIIDGLLRRKPVERMGLFDSPWGDTLEKWSKEEGYPLNKNSGKPAGAVEILDFDMVCTGGWFDAMPLRGVSEVVEESDEWIVKRNGAGAALKYWKHKSGTPEHVDFRMTSREIWERDYRPHLLKVDRERLKIADTKEGMAYHKPLGRWTFYGHLFVWEMMRSSMGDVCMYESLVLDPDWIKDYCRVYTDFYKMHYKIMIEEAGKPDGIWLYEDLGYNKGLFCSPAILEELIIPYFKEMVDFFHGYDLPVVLHSCGNITAALPLIVKAGFDGLNPMEAKAGCDVLAFAKEYKDKLAFIGGMDARIFEWGDRAKIKDEVLRLLNGMRNIGGRYVFGSDHSISPRVKLADFKYALEVFRQNARY